MAFIYLGYSGVILRTINFTIGIDVASLLSEKDIQKISKMDLLVYTHIHSDHFNAATAQKIYEKTGCFIAAEQNVYDALLGIVPAEKLIKLQGGESKEIYLETGRIVPSSIHGFHPVQIILLTIEVDGIRVFHGGDSGYSQSIKDLGHADIAFLPTGDPSPTASPEDALEMALDLCPKVIVLFHGSSAQHNSFINRAKSSLIAELIQAETGKVYAEDALPNK
ncbi:MAG: MBL fold metallo-hydrolase [Candidatus Brockarchaeota archaeon]|nr:MBL fold metallo-hydrolase [Candidatus Brockarchaeota archaeon]